MYRKKEDNRCQCHPVCLSNYIKRHNTYAIRQDALHDINNSYIPYLFPDKYLLYLIFIRINIIYWSTQSDFLFPYNAE